MKTRWRVALLLVLVVAVSGLSALMTSRYLWRHAPSEGVLSDYLHKELGLTATQRALVKESERQFEIVLKKLEDELQTANRALAADLRRDKSVSSSVTATLARITRLQDQLQRSMLEHVLSMEPHLTAEQYNHLIELCARSLEQH